MSNHLNSMFYLNYLKHLKPESLYKNQYSPDNNHNACIVGRNDHLHPRNHVY